MPQPMHAHLTLDPHGPRVPHPQRQAAPPGGGWPLDDFQLCGERSLPELGTDASGATYMAR